MPSSVINFNTPGNASASSPGLVSTGAQTFAGVKTFQDGTLGATPLATWDGTSDKTMTAAERVLWITGLTDNRTLKLPKSGVKKGDVYQLLWTATTAAKLGTIKDNAGSNTIDTFGEGAVGRATLIALMDEPDGALNTSWAVQYISEQMVQSFTFDTGGGSGASYNTEALVMNRENKTVAFSGAGDWRMTTGSSATTVISKSGAITCTHLRPSAASYIPQLGYENNATIDVVCFLIIATNGDISCAKVGSAWASSTANTGFVSVRGSYTIA